jgi:preprotein translocase subunit SecA
MGQIYRFLGLDTGFNSRWYVGFRSKNSYNADITYVTSELTFDFFDKHGGYNRRSFTSVLIIV